ncbi:MAG: CD225/dispanin family protein, partial [Acidimicrobiaceae bacterium]|nr:CD225/dispanin family protein [Acidimicrobiaceae bacterium]
ASPRSAVATRERPAPAPQQAGSWQANAGPPTYYWQALACLLLFLPTAIVALVYSFQVTRLARVGDLRGAVRSSRLARTWCLLSVLGFVVVFVLVANGVVSVGSNGGTGG